jgi:hypothetical protein
LRNGELEGGCSVESTRGLPPFGLLASFEVPPERLSATQVQPETEQPGCLLSAGAERYAVRYDEELEIVTSWQTYIDGTEAHRARLSFVHPMG